MINMSYVDLVLKEAEELNKKVDKTLRREEYIKEEQEKVKIKVIVKKK